MDDLTIYYYIANEWLLMSHKKGFTYSFLPLNETLFDLKMFSYSVSHSAKNFKLCWKTWKIAFIYKLFRLFCVFCQFLRFWHTFEYLIFFFDQVHDNLSFGVYEWLRTYIVLRVDKYDTSWWWIRNVWLDAHNRNMKNLQ